MSSATSTIPGRIEHVPPSDRAAMISGMLSEINMWQDCVLRAQKLEREDRANDAVSLLRAAEKKFPESKAFLHKNLFELMRRQRGQ